MAPLGLVECLMESSLPATAPLGLCKWRSLKRLRAEYEANYGGDTATDDLLRPAADMEKCAPTHIR